MFFIQTLASYAEPSKVMSLNFDDSSSIVYLNVQESADTKIENLKIGQVVLQDSYAETDKSNEIALTAEVKAEDIDIEF